MRIAKPDGRRSAVLLTVAVVLALALPALGQQQSGRRTHRSAEGNAAGPMAGGGPGVMPPGGMGMGGVGLGGPMGAIGAPGGGPGMGGEIGGGTMGPGMGAGGPAGPAGGFGGPAPAPTPWAAAGVPREAVLEWAMTTGPTDKDLPPLELLLEKALAIDPRMAEAQAQLQQAQAAVERVRMEVARQVVQSRAQWEARRRAVEYLSDALKKKPDDESLLQQYVNARARLAQVEMELPYVGQFQAKAPRPRGGSQPGEFGLAVGPMSDPGRGVVSVWPVTPNLAVASGSVTLRGNCVGDGPRPSVSPEIRKALQKEIQARFMDAPLGEVCDYLAKACGVQFQVNTARLEQFNMDSDTLMRIDSKGSLASILQLIEDQMPGLCFVMRPYGILVTHREFVEELRESEAMRALRQDDHAPGIPPTFVPGAPTFGPVIPGPASLQTPPAIVPIQPEPPRAKRPAVSKGLSENPFSEPTPPEKRSTPGRSTR